MATLEEELKKAEEARKALEAQREFYNARYKQGEINPDYVAPEGVFDYVLPENDPKRIARRKRSQALLDLIDTSSKPAEFAKFLPPNSMGVGNTPPAQSYGVPSAERQSAGGLLARYTGGYGMEGIKPSISNVINNAQSNVNTSSTESQGWMPQVNQSEYLKYKAVIEDAARKYNIDPELLSKLLYAESRFDPEVISGKRTSPKGAIGIAQFMPNTAASVAEVGNVNARNPVSSIYAAAHYLNNLYQQFGNWTDTVAAYNFGRGNVAAGREFPEETQKYVNEIVGDNFVSNNQQQTVVDKGNYITRDDILKNEIARQQLTEQKQDQPQSQNASILNSVVPFISKLGNKIAERRGISVPDQGDVGANQIVSNQNAPFPLGQQQPVTSTETFTDRVKGPEDVQGLANALKDKEVEQPGFIRKFLDKNPNLFPSLALAFNTMRLEPDQGLAAYAANQIEKNRELIAAKSAADRYEKLGYKEIANALRGGEITGKDAFATYVGLSKNNYEILTPERFKEIYGTDMPERYKDFLVTRNTLTGEINQIGSAGLTIGDQVEKQEDILRATGFQKNIDAYVELGQSAASTINSIYELRRLNRTGKVDLLPGALRELLPKALQNNETQAYAAILSDVARSQRVKGSGSQSDKDVDLLFQTAGSIAFNLEARETALDALDKKAKINAELAALARAYNGGTITKEEFNKQEKEILDKEILSKDERKLFQNFEQNLAMSPEIAELFKDVSADVIDEILKDREAFDLYVKADKESRKKFIKEIEKELKGQ